MFEKTGIGLRFPHVKEVLASRPDVGFLEVHAENCFRIGGAPFDQLMQCREHYPISLHGVGLSPGSESGFSMEHLKKLKALVDVVQPVLVSEHVSWSGVEGRYVPDLLPLPMTEEALEVVCRNVGIAQNELGRQILLENPTAYVALPGEMPEPEFLSEIVRRTSCGLLLDVNNVHVSACNTGFDAVRYLAALPEDAIGEIHLAGYQDNGGVLIDAHNRPVQKSVWTLYKAALERFGDRPALIEWDNDLPDLNALLAEAQKADALRDHARRRTHDRVA